MWSKSNWDREKKKTHIVSLPNFVESMRLTLGHHLQEKEEPRFWSLFPTFQNFTSSSSTKSITPKTFNNVQNPQIKVLKPQIKIKTHKQNNLKIPIFKLGFQFYNFYMWDWARGRQRERERGERVFSDVSCLSVAHQFLYLCGSPKQATDYTKATDILFLCSLSLFFLSFSLKNDSLSEMLAMMWVLVLWADVAIFSRLFRL